MTTRFFPRCVDVPTGKDCLADANRNGGQQAAHKEISGNHEDQAGFADAAQIHNRDEYENTEA